jgi:kumamolisin
MENAEAAMNVEWVGALAPGAKIVVYFIDPAAMGDPWAAFLFAAIGDREHAPTIVSTSWVSPERRYYRTHGHQVIAGLLDQAAALGLTVISASGDWGSFDGVPRTVRDGRYVSDAPWPHGIFPAVEDRVLGVGGSMITHRDPLTEVAWSGPVPPALRKTVHFGRLAASGGFSEDVPMPRWQASALRPYYTRGPGAPAVVPYGRGFPDVAIAASGPMVQRVPGGSLSSFGYQAVVSGRWIDFAGGTSIGAPIWAAIIARLNHARRARGLPRVGFVNPLLYRMARATPSPFREITSGSADIEMNAVNVHGQAVMYQLHGYECCPGWNPVTGLGVPRVSRLIELATDPAAVRAIPDEDLAV